MPLSRAGIKLRHYRRETMAPVAITNGRRSMSPPVQRGTTASIYPASPLFFLRRHSLPCGKVVARSSR